MKRLLLALAFVAGLAQAQTPIQHAIQFNWTIGAVDATHGSANGFTIGCSTTNGGPYSQQFTVSSGTATTYTSPEVFAEQASPYPVYCVIAAFNTSGASPQSAQASATIGVTPPAIPATPTGFTMTVK